MVCHGGFSLDEATRRSWYNPEAILKEAGLRKDMTFVDVGCGDGFFSVLAAAVVGETGRVYAVDVDASAIDRLKQKAAARGFNNVSAKAAPAEETVFCDACADVVFYSMVLHDFRDAPQVLRNARKMLKTSGTLVDLDWKKQEMPFGPPFAIRFSPEFAGKLMSDAGFSVQATKDVGAFHYVVLAKPSA